MFCLAAPPNIIDLPDDDDDVAPKPRKSKKVTAGRVARQEPTATPPVRQAEDAGRATVTFAAPLPSGHPMRSTALVVPSTIQLHTTELQKRQASTTKMLEASAVLLQKAGDTIGAATKSGARAGS